MIRPTLLLLLSLPAQAQVSWCPVLLGGSGDSNNLLAAATVDYGGSLYVGTFNPSGAELLAYDGASFTAVSIPAFSNQNEGILCGVVHAGELFLGTLNESTGAEVWSFDGGTWTQVGSAGLGGGSAAPAIDHLAVFSGKLYAGMDRAGSGSRIMEYQSPGVWSQVNLDGFGCGSANAEVYGLTAYAGDLYATTNNDTGGQLWRWDGGSASNWVRVDPGGVGCGAGGFGDGGQDTGAHALEVLGSPAALWVGTEHDGGAEVWRYDGSWTELSSGGFGDSDNFIVHDLQEHAGLIYAATENASSGCEVWAYDAGTSSWTRVDPGAPVGAGGFGAGAANEIAFELAEFQTRLLATTLNAANGAEVWRLGIGEPFCSATPNSTGSAASICAEGSASSSAGDLTLVSAPVPNQPGLFFHGNNRIQVSFGNGFLCAGGNLQRGRVVAASGHVARYVYDNSGPKFTLSGFVGSTRHFQHWFRDPMGGGAGFDTSNGVSVGIVP